MRLNKGIRQEICERAVAHGFKSEEKKLQAQTLKLSMEVYNHVYPKKVRDLMDQLPDGMLDTMTTFRVRAGGLTFCGDFDGKALPIGARDKYGWPNIESAPLCKKIKDNLVAWRALRSGRAKITDEVMATLDSVTTLKRLREIWPEAEPFLPTQKDRGVALSIPISELNKKLGLPARGS